MKACQEFTDFEHGVVFKLSILTGKSIERFSIFGGEAEVLILPQARFIVTAAPYEGADGYTYVDMSEISGDLFVS